MTYLRSYPNLLADIGGTNARFALETAPGKHEAILVLPCAHYPTLSDAIRAYLTSPVAAGVKIKKAGVAIANPVHSDVVQMTNHHWSFSIQAVQKEFDFQTLLVVNDFKALAMALPFLDHTQKYQVGTGQPQNNSAIGLLGAGTGLGVSGLIPTKHGWVALDSEGGHTSFSPTNQREMSILQFALQKYKHVSSERLMSGAGIQLIYQALASNQNLTVDDIDTPEITRRGLNNECPVCREVLSTFCELLGTMASNLAITLGAKGGIYIGGGIVPRLGEFFSTSNFRQRFEQKGRFANYLGQIPTYVITEPYPAFIGVSALLAQTDQ
ncbi:glucokinase [Solimicrobium silvestre]|uniref:Glucokinase n=1 Tax=Solimicrobium silvestre TaxID=2099400 RepID=A0A2S9H532_9BURK|nr:glucokinase [Solimicrobium silvestre]PRC94976.1 glk: glucokinase [Solimicrobium silvestre]